MQLTDDAGMSREYPQTPRVGIGAVVLKGRDVLLIRRAKPPRAGEWSLPGGLQKLGETVFQAAEREVMEETGVTIAPVGIIDVVDLIERDEPAGRIRWHYTLVDILARWREGEPVAGCDASEAIWADIADAPQLVRWPETARIIAQACRMLAMENPLTGR